MKSAYESIGSNSKLTDNAIGLLSQLVRTPSFSGEEEMTAEIIVNFLAAQGIKTERYKNNIWAVNTGYDPGKPMILLNSHHDTVKSNDSWTIDPFSATIQDGKLIGLGSNDAGASLVCLASAFCYLYNRKNMAYNLIFSATAEEETSGPDGIRSVLDKIGPVEMAIVGEPTGMQMAIAEKGLIVAHFIASGVAGHAARDVGENAILKAIKDIEWISTYKFPRESALLGPVKMTVTGIQAGIQHNVIPDKCSFMVDIRSTDAYTHQEILETITSNINSKIEKCSNDLNPSALPENHILGQAAARLGIGTFTSPTLSDQALIPAPSVKIGPGRSERSHTADEFVYLAEIEEGIRKYIALLEEILM